MSTPQAETKAEAEALVPQFQLERVLNQDQNGRRISLLGSIAGRPALITLERAAFPTEPELVSSLLKSLINTTNLGANDIYRWYMANRSIDASSPSSTGASSTSPSTTSSTPIIPDFKLNMIYPCSPQHIRKYSAQRVRMVTETPHIYATHIRPYIASQRAAGRLDWVFNILEGRTEQEDVIARVDWDCRANTGFLLLPDLNWDRKTVEGMHLLALVQRRDIWSLRDLRRKHVPWLKAMREQIVAAVIANVFPPHQGHGHAAQLDPDEIKCYLHYQPTYYHLHVHVVHVMLEAGTTQSVGKAFGLGNLIAQLEGMRGDDDEAGMHEVDLHYFLGEENELWKKCFGPLKRGEAVELGG
ncbi:m7GpppX diphosphatase [Fonsecaea pedrosoi]|nr:m7GpppX diphosphatase [Fonsecaea pedrosoi]